MFGTMSPDAGILSPVNVSTFTTATLNCLLATDSAPNDEI